MTYAQIKSGCKLHLVFEPGEGWSRETSVPAGQFSKPICNQIKVPHYRMTINVPLGNACKKCVLVYNSRIEREGTIKRKI